MQSSSFPLLLLLVLSTFAGCDAVKSSLRKVRGQRAAAFVRSSNVEPAASTKITTENKIRSLLHKQAGSIHTVLLTRAPGRPLPLGIKLRHGHMGSGMEVDAVEDDSGAYLAGLRSGDIIKSPNGPEELTKLISKGAIGPAGDVILQVIRKGDTDQQQLTVSVPIAMDIVPFGLALSTTSRSDGIRECPVFEIVKIETDSIAAHASPRLAVGDIILAVNGVPAPSNHDMVERMLSKSARVVMTIFDGETFECPAIDNNEGKNRSSASLTDSQLRDVLHTLSPSDIAQRLDIVGHELTKIQRASHACAGSVSCTTGHIDRIHQALKEETQGCVRAQSMYKLYYDHACARARTNVEKSKCVMAKNKTDAAVARECDPLQREATCASIRVAWDEYYARRCTLIEDEKKCKDEKVRIEEQISETCKKPEIIVQKVTKNKTNTTTNTTTKKVGKKVVEHVALPKNGVELDCNFLRQKCHNQTKYRATVVCGSDGKSYTHICKLNLQSCWSMQKAVQKNQNPLLHAIEKVQSGPCEKCRHMKLVKDAALFAPGFGMVIGDWTSKEGQSFPQVQHIPRGTVAANSGLLFEGDVIIKFGASSTCNKWSEQQITSNLKNTETVELTVCTPSEVTAVATKICPKATLNNCTRIQLHDNSLSSNQLSLDVRKGRCGSFPVIKSNDLPAGSAGSLLISGTILFSVGGMMQCNHPVDAIAQQVSTSSGPVIVDLCPPSAVETDFICNYICKAPVVPPPQPVIEQLADDKEENIELWPDVIVDHSDQSNLIAPNCRRITLTKARSKYGIDIQEMYHGSTRRFVVTRVHEGRGLDDADILVNDTLSVVDSISVDELKDASELAQLMSSANTSTVLITRDGIDHDVERTLRRDPLGFGIEFGLSPERLLTCGVQFPFVTVVDSLMAGLVDESTNKYLVNKGDLVVHVGHGKTLCNPTMDSFAENFVNKKTIVLEICPSATPEDLQMYNKVLCERCISSEQASENSTAALTIKAGEEDKEEKKETEEEEEKEDAVKPAASGGVQEQSKEETEEETTAAVQPVKQGPTDQREFCESLGNKWCMTEFPTLLHTGICIDPAKSCPIQGPEVGDFELQSFCKKHPHASPSLCAPSNVDGAIDLPLPEPHIPPPPGQEEPPTYPAVPSNITPKVEKVGQVCRPGGFCPYGECPKLYRKTLDSYCGPTDDAPRILPKDPNHICLPGSWCPPAYPCPTGFEKKVSGSDGFCFDTNRQAPMLAPEFVGSDFDPYSFNPRNL